jgi:glycosyltransferase involved in cell wall biosynthesis
MKIVHILPFFLPDAVAGTEVYCWSLCKYLQRRGVTVEVIIPGYDQDQTTEYIYDGIKVTRYAEPTKSTRLHIAGLSLPGGIKTFRECLKSANPDCVHFHGIYGGVGITFQHIVESKALGIPVVYTMHLPTHLCRTQTLVYKQQQSCDGVIRPIRCAACAMAHQERNEWMTGLIVGASAVLQKVGIDAAKWDNPLGTGLSSVNRIVDIQRDLKRMAGLTDRVVLYAQWFKKMMIANGFPAEKLEYIPPALSFAGNIDAPIAPVAFKYPGSLKLIFAGRLHPSKGIHLMLEALQGLPKGSVELSIYGKEEVNEYTLHCRSLAEGKDYIHWRGLLPREQLLATFRQHDILCLASAFSEMSPLVIQEAFAAGIPVLASEVHGNAELIQPGKNGLLFPFKSMEGFLAQVQRLITDKNLLPSLKSQIKPPLTFDKIGDQYWEVYKQVCPVFSLNNSQG